MESPKGFLGDGLMKKLLIEMRTKFGEAERDESPGVQELWGAFPLRPGRVWSGRRGCRQSPGR